MEAQVGNDDGSDWSDEDDMDEVYLAGTHFVGESVDGDSDGEGDEQGRGQDFARVRFLRSLMTQSQPHLEWSLQRIASLSNLTGARGRSFKDELRRQGVIEIMTTALSAAEQSRSRSFVRNLRFELFNALSRCLFDHRENAACATELGLLKITAAALSSEESGNDPDLSECQLCCANNICGYLSEYHAVLGSDIIPVLIRYAGGAVKTTETGREIAIAALANLSNAAELCQYLLVHGAVEVLSTGLRSVEDDAEEPTVCYMQALSAVVKTVGRSTLMGAMGLRFSQAETEDGRCPSTVFRVCGRMSSSAFDQAKMSGLLVDRRSARWILGYLSASLQNQPYPPTSNIYGTAWKVAQSVACMANGSAQNRELLCEEGVWHQVSEPLGLTAGGPCCGVLFRPEGLESSGRAREHRKQPACLQACVP